MSSFQTFSDHEPHEGFKQGHALLYEEYGRLTSFPATVKTIQDKAHAQQRFLEVVEFSEHVRQDALNNHHATIH